MHVFEPFLYHVNCRPGTGIHEGKRRSLKTYHSCHWSCRSL